MTMALKAQMQTAGLKPRAGYRIALHSCKSAAVETVLSHHSFFWEKVWKTDRMPGTTLSSLTPTKAFKELKLSRNHRACLGTV